jgi:hypothetical protein
MQVVYVISNPAMPGLVKIGFTAQEDAKARIEQLYSSGVPVPFKLEFACRVENAEEVERALHRAFAPNRINSKREFFQIEADQAIAILKLLHNEDATSDVAEQPTILDQESIVAADQLQSRRPNLNFEEMGIPTGSILHSTHSEATVTVVGPRKVVLNNEEMSLTAATRQTLGLEYSVAPGPHWMFGGKILREIYNETYTGSGE